MQRHQMEGLSREELITHAERLGVPRPRVLTHPELMDEILSRAAKTDRDRAKARGWLGRARDLLAQVVEKGLHLPEAARVLRSQADDRPWPTPPPPLPTVTLAEIYAAQGHLERAIAVLDEVIAREPGHAEAQLLRARFCEQSRARPRGRSSVVTPIEIEAASMPPTVPEPERPQPPKPEIVPPVPPKPEVERPPVERPQPKQSEVEEPPAKRPEVEPTPKRSEIGEPPATKPEVGRSATKLNLEAMKPKLDEPQRKVRAETSSTPAAVNAPSAGLDEAALPERYDVDEIVAIAVDPRTIYLYWEVRATSLARARARHPEGWLGVRIAAVTASWEGPVVKVRDLRIDSLYGDRFVRDVEPGSNIRVSVGWQAGDEFEPFAIGIEVTAPHLRQSDAIAGEVDRWTPEAGGGTGALRVPPFDRPVPEIVAGPAQPAVWAASPPAGGGVYGGASGATNGAPRRRPGAAPADTGVEHWNEGPIEEEISSRTFTVIEIRDGAWFRPGGASELGQGGPAEERRIIRESERRRGGASELGRGGASELGRGGASELGWS